MGSLSDCSQPLSINLYLIHYVWCEPCCIKSLDWIRAIVTLNCEVMLCSILVCREVIISAVSWRIGGPVSICGSIRWLSCSCIAVIWVSAAMAIISVASLQKLGEQGRYCFI